MYKGNYIFIRGNMNQNDTFGNTVYRESTGAGIRVLGDHVVEVEGGLLNALSDAGLVVKPFGSLEFPLIVANTFKVKLDASGNLPGLDLPQDKLGELNGSDYFAQLRQLTETSYAAPQLTEAIEKPNSPAEGIY